MNQETTTRSDDGLDLGIYIALLCLTAATLAASHFTHGGRIMAVVLALVIASIKASLIGFYYMGLRRERAMMFIILGIGSSCSDPAVGILPDRPSEILGAPVLPSLASCSSAPVGVRSRSRCFPSSR